MILSPKCYDRRCKYYIGVDQPDGTERTEHNVCKAFPDGIPDEIAYGDDNHSKPFPGDNGIQYEQEKPE